jgi:hypothetical protein
LPSNTAFASEIPQAAIRVVGGWGLLAVLLIVLWVRSYAYVEVAIIPVPPNHSLGIGSVGGAIGIGMNYSPGQLRSYQYPYDRWKKEVPAVLVPHPIWGGIVNDKNLLMIYMPDWVLLGLIAAAGLSTWLRQSSWRFGLRSPLVATTLVAVVLGLIVWAVR